MAVKLLPRASRNELMGPAGSVVRIKVTAPPVDAAANEALVAFLANALGCRPYRVRLLRGHASRHKGVLLHGYTREQVVALLGC